MTVPRPEGTRVPQTARALTGPGSSSWAGWHGFGDVLLVIALDVVIIWALTVNGDAMESA